MYHALMTRNYYSPTPYHHTCDHVFDVVSMSRTVDVAVVAFLCLVLYVCSVDGDASLLLLWCIVNVRILLELGGAGISQHYSKTDKTIIKSKPMVGTV